MGGELGGELAGAAVSVSGAVVVSGFACVSGGVALASDAGSRSVDEESVVVALSVSGGSDDAAVGAEAESDDWLHPKSNIPLNNTPSETAGKLASLLLKTK